MVQTKLIDNEESELYKCCPLHKTRTNIVWSRGTSIKHTDVLWIGEAPGRDEDLQGRPFVGKAGQILNRWIEEANVTNYAIINIVKCRPPGNRKPYPNEIRSCLPYLTKQIQQFNPKIIVALGATPCYVLTNRKELVTNIGKIFQTRYGKILIFPHPAYILRGVNVYIPITELQEILGNIKKEVKHEEKGRI